MAKRLPIGEGERLAESIRALLADPDAHLTRDGRLRWEGALTAVEAVLGKCPSLLAENDGVDVL